MFKNILIIGTGMIGSSIALGIKNSIKEVSNKSNINIIGWDDNKKHRQNIIELGIVDKVAKNISDGIANVDLIILAVPLGVYREIFLQINEHSNPKKPPLITDVGSTKNYVINQAKKHLQNFDSFVPAHPIAGREKSGPQAADAKLFYEHYVIITPTESNRKSDINKIKRLWESIGANIEIMDANTHDEICAGISHMPHLLSMALVHYLLGKAHSNKHLKFAAGGFRDFTRIAASDPKMWNDVFMANKTILLKNLTQLEKSLKEFRKLINNGKNLIDNKQLLKTIAKVSTKRKKWQANVK